jgi:hypothetical protein
MNEVREEGQGGWSEYLPRSRRLMQIFNMNNSLVAEDKVKFPCQVGLIVSNSQLMAFVEMTNRRTLRVRHLYDQSVKDLTVEYEHAIQ